MQSGEERFMEGCGTTRCRKNTLYDIDGLSTYRLVSPNCNLLLQKVKDGRPWKKNSSTKWSDLKKFDLKIVVVA